MKLEVQADLIIVMGGLPPISNSPFNVVRHFLKRIVLQCAPVVGTALHYPLH